MERDDWKWAVGCLAALVLVTAIPLWLLLGPLHSTTSGARQLGAILVFVGVLKIFNVGGYRAGGGRPRSAMPGS
jgi:hypothetical protein